jgi:adenylate cyclase
MDVEIERTFLLPGTPAEIEGAPAHPIAQGYLSVGEDGTEVRLRRRGDRTLLTAKRGAGERRLEAEVEIPAAAFDELWPLTEGRRVEKERFVVAHGEHDVEVDVYAGALAGLVLAEVEFATEAQSAAFAAPAWLGREVTGDERYANRRLAIDGRPDEEQA